MSFKSEKPGSAGGLKLAITMEPESWILRRFGGYLQQFVSAETDCRLVELHEPVPADTDAIVYANWLHLYHCPPLSRRMPGLMMVGHMDRTAFRFRYLLWRYPRLQVICMSQSWKRTLRRYFIPESRLHLIPHGIDLELFQPAAKVPDSRRTRIGFVGRAYPDGRKGEDRLFEIGRQLSRSDYEFVLVGDRWEKVVEGLRSLGFQVEYHRKLKTEEISAVMGGLDVLLVCARNEGGPQPVLEALACGVPVISTDVGFVPDFQKILPGQVTLYAQTEEAVKHLSKAKANRLQAQAASAVTRQHLTPFTWAAWAASTERLCQAMVGRAMSARVEVLQPDAR